MYKIDADLKELIESGVATIVATGDASGRPHVRFGWGPRVQADASTIDVYLDSSRAEQTLANLAENGRIAMTVADPVSYRSVQFKGAFVSQGPVAGDEMEEVGMRHEGFLVATSLIGDPPELIRGLWTDEVVRVTFTVDAVFDQTPGPEAGKPL